MIRVLVVDDSATARELLKKVLESDPEIEVVASASNGREAIELVRRVKPDIVTMDLLMPVMNGFEATEHLMAFDPLPILVVTGCPVGREADLAFKALELGALEVNEKPESSSLQKPTRRSMALIRNVRTLSKVQVITHLRGRRGAADRHAHPPEAKGERRLVVIASSTGGPPVLEKIFSSLPPEFPAPIVVVQHIADGFTGRLVEWLGKSSPLPVREAGHRQPLNGGTISLIPDGHHGTITSNGAISLNTDPPVDGVRPSGDLLFKSAARARGQDVVAVVLTGMGHDGAEGARVVRAFGGTVIVQNKETCAIFGMPRAVIQEGLADAVVPDVDISAELVKAISRAER